MLSAALHALAEVFSAHGSRVRTVLSLLLKRASLANSLVRFQVVSLFSDIVNVALKLSKTASLVRDIYLNMQAELNNLQ